MPSLRPPCPSSHVVWCHRPKNIWWRVKFQPFIIQRSPASSCLHCPRVKYFPAYTVIGVMPLQRALYREDICIVDALCYLLSIACIAICTNFERHRVIDYIQSLSFCSIWFCTVKFSCHFQPSLIIKGILVLTFWVTLATQFCNRNLSVLKVLAVLISK